MYKTSIIKHRDKYYKKFDIFKKNDKLLEIVIVEIAIKWNESLFY